MDDATDVCDVSDASPALPDTMDWNLPSPLFETPSDFLDLPVSDDLLGPSIFMTLIVTDVLNQQNLFLARFSQYLFPVGEI